MNLDGKEIEEEREEPKRDGLLPLPYIVFLRRITIKKFEKKKKGETFLSLMFL